MTTPFRKMVLKGSILVFIAMLVSRFFGYLFHSLFAKSFTTAEYGLYVYLWSVTMLIAGIGLLGIAAGASRFIAYFRGSGDEEKVKDYFKTGFWLTSCLLMLCIFVVALFLGRLVSMDSVSLYFVCILLFLHGIGFYFGYVVSGYRKPEVTNMNLAAGQVIKVLLLFIVVYFAAGFGMALLSFLLATLFGYGSNVIYFLRRYGFAGRFRLELANELVKFGVYVVLTDTSNNLLSWASIFMIQYFMGYSVVAVFNAAYLFSSGGLILFMSIIEVYSPVVTELLGSKDYRKCSLLSSYLFESFFLLFLPPFLILSLFSKDFLTVFFTPEYATSSLALSILLFGSFLSGVALLLRKFIIADGRPNIDAKIIVSAAVVNLALNYLFIQWYGINGAAFATMLSSVLLLALSFKYVGDKICLSFSKIRLAKILAATVISSAIVHLIRNFLPLSLLSILIYSAIWCAVYAAAILLMKSLRREDVEMSTVLLDKAYLPKGIRQFILAVLHYGIR